MTEIDNLFRKRLGIPVDEHLSFEGLNVLLERIATTIPFENLCVISKKTTEITKEHLVEKILVKNEGGLCYELNTLLYYFLLQNDFKVEIARAIVFDQNTGEFAAIGRTHVIILLTYQDETYVVDTGFGGNLPLKPVPLDGETVSSFNGDFRIRKIDSHHGDYVLEMKLKHKDTVWRTGYAFHSLQPVKDISEMNEVQQLIHESPLSSFNKSPLVTKLTHRGNLILTNQSFTISEDGNLTKIEIQPNEFRQLAKQYFERDIE